MWVGKSGIEFVFQQKGYAVEVYRGVLRLRIGLSFFGKVLRLNRIEILALIFIIN